MNESASSTGTQRLWEGLTENLLVSLTAVAFALAAFFLIPLGEAFEVRFLLAISFLTLVFVYDEYWPRTDSAAYAVLWTVGAGLLTAGIFIGVYELAFSLGSGELTRAVALLVTTVLQYGSAILYSRAQ
jgi:hypothetical protein